MRSILHNRSNKVVDPIASHQKEDIIDQYISILKLMEKLSDEYKRLVNMV